MIVALVSRTGDVLDAYLRFFEKNGVTPSHFLSVTDLYRKLPEMMINGVVIDMPTLLKAAEPEKIQLQTIESIFPNVRATWNPKAGFHALFHDGSKSGEENLKAFLQSCRDFKARSLRKDKRKTKHLNVLFWLDDAPEETAQRAFTFDVCHGGMFVCTCDAPPVGAVVRIKWPELGELPLKLLVRWRMPWGVAARIPGFGGSFMDLQGDQASQVDALLT